MFVKKIQYTDYDGNERNEDFYFNLTKAEIIDWLLVSKNYTLDKVLLELTQTQDTKRILDILKDIIYRAYGKKSLDGRRFMKDDETKREFTETEAYSILYTELAFDSKKAGEFINAIIPSDLANEVNKAIAENPDGIPAEMKDYISSTPNNVMKMPTQ